VKYKERLKMANNQAIVAKLKNITAIPNADKICQADVVVNDVKLTQVIVSREETDNKLVVYFDSNLCLNEKLIEKYPELGKYLGKGQRVKTIKLKGVISNGLCIDIDRFLDYFKDEDTAFSTLKEGYEFDKIGDFEVCKKWIPKENNHVSTGNGKKGVKGKRTSRMIQGQFNFHFETSHLLKNIHMINPTDIISVSRKLHGTSVVISNCKVKRKLKWFETTISKYLKFIKLDDTEYDMVYASRRVVKNSVFNQHFYSEDVWTAAGKTVTGLFAGETLYGEIVGFTSDGGFIQKGYDYKCDPNTFALYIYRITNTGADGNVIEYSWQMMRDRCLELGLKMVPEVYYGYAKDMFPELSLEQHWNVNFLESLRKTYLEKDCDLCNTKVPDEGVVVRKEGLDIQSFKLKSEKFILRESDNKDKDVVDIEDVN
jgi:hypothetical protein